MSTSDRGELIVYRTEDGQAEVQLHPQDGSVWLNQAEMAELFETTKQNVSLHIKNILKEGELPEAATVKESLTVQNEGSRRVQRKTSLYNLHMILAVGYRVTGKIDVRDCRHSRGNGSPEEVTSVLA